MKYRLLSHLSITITCAASVLILVGAGGQARASDTIIVQWNDATLEGIRQTRPGPPIVARMLAMVDTAMYDAWTAHSRNSIPLYDSGVKRQLSSATDANKIKAISYAAYRVEVDLFPTFTTAANDLMASLGFDPNDTSTDPATPTGIGNRAAAAVLAARHHDGSNQLGDLHPGPYTDYTGYMSVNTPDQINDPNRWQPLRVSDGMGGFVVQIYIAPFWGKVTPFAKLPKYRGNGPDLLPGDDAIEGARRILKYSADLTDEQKVIAEYWKDGPRSELPPGHWALFAEFVSRRDLHTIDQDAQLFFAQSNALLDAGIFSWAVKRQFDSVRPVTLVHFLFKGKKVLAWGGPFQGTKIIDGETWEPYQPTTLVTPPFPEYLSGHSIFSAAGAEVLKNFTGRDTFRDSVTFAVGSSVVEPGLTPRNPVTLFWKTFSDAADQAGLSRRYGGIHFIPGDLDARKFGREIGRRAWAKSVCLFAGKRPSVGDGDDDQDNCETPEVVSSWAH
jgi:hypothetical protein